MLPSHLLVIRCVTNTTAASSELLFVVGAEGNDGGSEGEGRNGAGRDPGVNQGMGVTSSCFIFKSNLHFKTYFKYLKNYYK